MTITGVLPPIPTPFRADEVDLEALRSNIDRWMRTGVAGVVALGTNGEAALLTDDESDRVIAIARERTPRDRLLVAGTGRESTAATVAACRRAGMLGVDAVLVRTPSTYRAQMLSEALLRHFQAVADASPVPVILYNFPQLTGVTLRPETIARLAGHPNIHGLKESSGDVGMVAAAAGSVPAGFSVLVGSATVFYPSLCVGASGGVLAVACVAPEACIRLWRLVTEGRHAEALVAQRHLTPLARLVTTEYGVPGLKAALDLAGYLGGESRAPIGPPPPQAIDLIRQQLRALDAAA